jgi:hypothetical protein
MKLTIATLAATLTIAGAASAMTESAGLFDDPRAAALGANGQSVSGAMAKVDIDQVFEPRARALNSSEEVYVSVFAQDAPAEVQIDAER